MKKDIFNNFPQLFNNSTFDNNSFNIEGLSFHKTKGTLLLGLRSPLLKQKAILIEILNPNEMFESSIKAKFSNAISLDLNNLGIRDLAYDEVKKGFWILAGSATNRDNRDFELWFLNENMQNLKKLDNIPKIGYAEGISVITSAGKTKLLIVEDNGKKPNRAANYITINKDSL